MNTQSPSSDVSVTAPGCAACGGPLSAGRSRRFCSSACRQAAFRRRHQSAAARNPLQPRRSRLEGTIYQCPECETRYLSEQWCPDCSRPCQRLGAGGICPCCEEVITVEKLTENTPADMWPRLSSRAWRSGARMASRVPLRLAGSGLMSWRACRLRDGAVMLICAGWLPQGRAVRQERFCWSRYRA